MLRFRGERMDVMKLMKLLTLAKQLEVDLPRKDEKPPEEVREPGKDEQQLGEKEQETREDKEQLANAKEKKDPDRNST